jgi:hypothetical protein
VCSLWESPKRSGAAQKNSRVLPIGNRGKLRDYYRQVADQMQRIAKFLRRTHPYGMPSYPHTQELAQMLDEAAEYYRKQVELRRNQPGVLRFSRNSKPEMIFMSMVSNYLQNITGHWLDKAVAILTKIAFDAPHAIEPEAVRWARTLRGKTRTLRKRRR